MRKYLIILLVTTSISSYGQTNTFPASGNVGIGTGSNPTLGTLQIAAPDKEVSSAIAIRQSNAYAYGFDFGLDQNVNGNGYFYAVAGGNKTPLIQFDRLYNNVSFINSNVGIGTPTPISKLHIGGDNYLTIGDYSNSNGVKGIQFTGWRDVANNYFGASIEATPSWACCGNYPNGGYAGIKNISLNFNVHNNQDIADSKLTAMVIIPGGNVGIGTAIPTTKLAVNGTIRAQEVKVEAANWPDYVFTPEHKLPSLETLATQIKEQGHLPNIPSAEEVSKSGIALGEMNKKLLEKVEELTLYAIKQNEESRQQKEQIKELKVQSEEMRQLKELLLKQSEQLKMQQQEIKALKNRVK